MEKILDRFLNYVSFETTSDENSNTCPSTKGQVKLGNFLVEELKSLGIDAKIDENGYVYGSIPGNAKAKNTVGFIAHMDTSPDMSGKNIKANIIKNYNGCDIKLNDDFTTTVSDFPFLKDLKGETIITTDGNTLLGADDKAGIAIIISAIEELLKDKDAKYGDIKIAFTPDEEIGRGADKFDVKKFGADFAFTVDGGPIGELEYETFNAASCKVEIQGKNVHPGSAKDVMVNSQLIAMEFNSMLPVKERPEYTEGYEGFSLLIGIEGSVEFTKMNYIIRNHSKEKFEEMKNLFENIARFLNKKYDDRIKIEIKDQYYNMKEKIEDHMEIIDLAKTAFDRAGVLPKIGPVRGGTDGSKLSFMGLPTPNIFTGGYNYHGRYELVSLDQMKKSKEVVKNIAKLLVE
ncbi:MAG: peptidase T [Peptoniphilus sp.]|uniref:peptidase T n=1 Tax=Peptoniphilus sp. TaxID=1971214 RepID=UPI0025DF298E|nr:peptidase T [Peptoniphilus sp.]MCI5643142.1 peptidase T [Peptoniphilus sp.]MDD7352269.1 peptidase T [Peptoniphilaceae bacterium]MDY3902915.1 peptidase T [Peptoniphilus sp.]